MSPLIPRDFSKRATGFAYPASCGVRVVAAECSNIVGRTLATIVNFSSVRIVCLFGPRRASSRGRRDRRGGRLSSHSDADAFRGFVINSAGGFTCTATLGTTRRPNRRCGPLFVCNGDKLNGARLLGTVGGHVLRGGPSTGILCAADRGFAGSLVCCLKGGGVNRFRSGCEGISTLLVSSVRFVTGGGDARRRFFRAFGTLARMGGRVILASSGPPSRVPALRSELGAHFG